MDHYEISAALLAERIEVQRSSISHILSGRNKPSLEFVLKILKTFPEVELYWLVNGVGEFPKQIKNIAPTPMLFSTDEQDKDVKKAPKPAISNEAVSDIERIVVFFKDGSFKNYNS